MSVKRNVTVPMGSSAGLTARAGGAISVMVLLLRDRPEPAGQLADDRQREGWMIAEDALEVPGGDGEAARRQLGDDLGDPRQAVEHRELAEELRRAECREQHA